MFDFPKFSPFLIMKVQVSRASFSFIIYSQNQICRHYNCDCHLRSRKKELISNPPLSPAPLFSFEHCCRSRRVIHPIGMPQLVLLLKNSNATYKFKEFTGMSSFVFRLPKTTKDVMAPSKCNTCQATATSRACQYY